MKSYTANLINSIVLVALGLWGYFGSDSPSPTALIPVYAGVVLFVLGFGIKKENKTISHITVVLTLLILISLLKPLTASIGREDQRAMMRVIIMMITSAYAMVAFVKSFIDARKNK